MDAPPTSNLLVSMVTSKSSASRSLGCGYPAVAAGCLFGLGQTLLERLELVPDAGRQLVADELEPLFDQRQLLAPLGGIDRQRAVDVGGVDVEPVKVEVVGGGNDADRRLLATRLVLDAVDDPLEHTAVLTEARPEELAAFAAPEPGDEEHLRQLGLVRVLAQVDLVLEVVAHVVAEERQHGHRVAAHVADLAFGRGGLLAA